MEERAACDAGELARAMAGSPAWCRLDFGEQGRSLCGRASEVLVAERGREREFLARLRSELGDSAGWAVALSYEFGAALLGLEPAADVEAPAFALRFDEVVEIAEAAGAGGGAGGAMRRDDPRGPSEAGWRKTPAQYRAGVEACRSAIRDGEAYVLCLTDTAEPPVGPVDPLALYERLGAGAVRGGVIVAGERALVSASPERFLSVRGDRIETHPIKGTRPRGATPEADAVLARELGADPKERAENLMIVDLMRNDLSRFCVPGTVETRGFLRVETHPHVHQLVSTVAGRIAPGRDVYDAIEACFPGGSMTGAPKHRAVEILEGLEAAPRGLYSGCFGWIGRDGDAELAMTIRSIELRGLGSAAPTARIGAGGGVTIDSDARREQEERDLKAAPLLAALRDAGLRPPPR